MGPVNTDRSTCREQESMSIEKTFERIAEAQERTATAMEAVLKLLSADGFQVGGSVQVTGEVTPASEQVIDQAPPTEEKAPTKPRKPATKPPVEEKPADPPAEEQKSEEPETDPLADEPEADPLADDAPPPTKDELRTALRKYQQIEGTAAMLEVLKTHGRAAALNDVKEADYAAVMAAVK